MTRPAEEASREAGEAQPVCSASLASRCGSDQILFTSCSPVLVFRAPPRPSRPKETSESPSLLDSPSVKLLPSAPSLLQLFSLASSSSSSTSSSPSSSSSSSTSSSPASSPFSASSSSPASSASSPAFATLSQLRHLSVHPLFASLGAYFRRGGLVAFPTETVYGLGAAATVPAACNRVFFCKKRPASDPLICHVVSVQQAFEQVFDLDEEDSEQSARDRLTENPTAFPRKFTPQERRDLRLLIETLADAFWPGPLSIVAKGKILEDRKDGTGVALAVTAGTRLVAVRCPNHPYALSLIAAAGVPIAAPSANRFGRISPTRAKHVLNQFAVSQPAEGPTVPSSSPSSLSPSSWSAPGFAGESARGARSVESEAACGGSAGNGAAENESDDGRELKKRKATTEGFTGETRRVANDALATLLSQRPDGDEMVLLDGEEEDCCCLGIESTVIKIAPPSLSSSRLAVYDIEILRRGVISAEMVAETLEAAREKSPAFPSVRVRVSEKLQYHLTLEKPGSSPSSSPRSADASSASSDKGARKRDGSDSPGNTAETPRRRQRQQTPDLNGGRKEGNSHARSSPQSSETRQGADDAMESPGLALTHYAPCLPCMLIVSGGDGGNANAANDERVEEPARRDRTQDSATEAESTDSPPFLEGSSVVVIDADRSLRPLRRHFLRYISILSPGREAGGVQATADTSNGECTDTAQAGRETEEEKWKKLSQIAAGNVFAALHEAEAIGLQLGAKAILINAAPLLKGREAGLAVFDRLFRAASGKQAQMRSATASSPTGVQFFPL
ncbi:sua5/YciO/YrdC/YwlC family protein, related [Neospora caninum Liverpool]|uniref:Threonylcarbamoyl-AMP synthase n=1 Tax=Neospora caninum (strain Liverpool) TaxID=572307 RepID=F0V7A2_NEOCL|nr:sua5/YciO/YrdC/YwlC family protein, related [Neospora caninum Liverpool]CBZ49593.1 sua5/YciO/YrdC/YwlC family protein, related [Neospora caninum Liverpool]CEL64173.1 TPA: Sua5/YciO/YrdC/YwlC family protein, related [Neospora caninum Liverpool]|eukprot:XP_003879628.1 sua5/YciO/YrdC/YwlC family protein, related [Neospora caninum Liverpool]